ncbi:MAG: hypothetical protein V4683_12445 [Bacteroidota bacterium]
MKLKLIKSPAVSLIGLVLPLFINQAFAQSIENDSIFYAKAISNTIAKYNNVISYQSRLYNGKQYASYPFTFKEGHPFFESIEMSKGSIVYDNQFCLDVLLQFDEVSEVVIFKDQTHFTQLLSDKISEFTLLGSKFIRIEKDSSNSIAIKKSGFFNVIYEGSTLVLKQEIKYIKEDISIASDGIKRSINSKEQYYVRKNNEYFIVDSKKDMLNIFKNHRNEIVDYKKTNKLNFRNDKQNSLVKIAQFYDKLSVIK